MTDFLLLNIFLLFFLLVTALETLFAPNLKRAKETSVKLSPKFLVVFVGVVFVLVLLIFSKAPKDFSGNLVKVVFTLLILGQARWISLGKDLKFSMLMFLSAIFLIVFRYFFPNDFSHNLFILASMVWLGPFLTELDFVDKKNFILISLAWFLYDVGFVWITSFYETIGEISAVSDFALGISVGENFLGVGDLLWGNFFVSLFKKNQEKIKASLVLVIVNLVFGALVLSTKQSLDFPLLVLWAPIGILVFMLKDYD